MIGHVVTYNFTDRSKEEQNLKIANKFKEGIENLAGKIAGIISIKVMINLLPSSNVDIVLVSLFENEQSLKDYAVHPEHIKVADFIKGIFKDRKCFDYIEK